VAEELPMTGVHALLLQALGLGPES
jgi:hypothetical protein